MNTSKSLRIHNEYLSGLKENPHIQNRTRMFSIGATDTSAILGLNKYKSPYALWLEKTGRVQPEDISMKWPVRIGKASEEMISAIYIFLIRYLVWINRKRHTTRLLIIKIYCPVKKSKRTAV